jgi:hypothetical protein
MCKVRRTTHLDSRTRETDPGIKPRFFNQKMEQTEREPVRWSFRKAVDRRRRRTNMNH